jgi:hypothetical protein
MSDLRVPPSNAQILGLWFAWVLATTIGVSVGLFAGNSAFDHLWYFALCAAPLALGALVGILQGPIIGMMHRLILGSEAAWPITFRWVLATTLGLLAGFILAIFLSLSTEPESGDWWLGLVLGFFVGLVQSPILRRQSLHAILWILANTLGWGIGFAVLEALRLMIGDHDNNALGVGKWEGVVSGAIIGGITGILLIWLFQHAKSLEESPLQIRDEADLTASD